MTQQQTIDAVREWGIAKGITGPSGRGTLLGQLSKTQEELTETRDAAIEWVLAEGDELGRAPALEKLADGIGDSAVTLILAAEMAGLKFEDCLAGAYAEIKNRTGRMAGGTFIKDR